jgi:hypothetical protein
MLSLAVRHTPTEQSTCLETKKNHKKGLYMKLYEEQTLVSFNFKNRQIFLPLR